MKHRIAIGLVICQIAGLGWSEQPSRGHEQIDDPYVEVAEADRVTSPVGVQTRGEYSSIQVNTDPSGFNIVGDAANEPSIAVHPGDRTRISIGWRQFDTTSSNFRQAGSAYSTDGGRSWTNLGVLDPGVFRSDPVLRFAPDGTLYYDSLTKIGDFDYRCDVFLSDNAGQGWSGPNPAYGGDKQWIALDHTSGPGHGHFYQAWDWAGCCGDDWFNRSTDGGLSFEYPIAIPEQPYWGVSEVGPDGAFYVIGQTISPDVFAVARSSSVQNSQLPMSFDGAFAVDLGGSQVFNQGNGPNPGGLGGQVWIAADHSDESTRGNLYSLCSVDPPGSDPLDVHLVRSTDRGETWSAPTRVNDDPAISNTWQWFGTMAVGGNGRIDVVWNDTSGDPQGFDSELRYSYSTDSGMTWAPSEPVSPVFDPHLGWPNQEKLGDYYDIASDRVGAHIAYAATMNGEQDVYYLRIGDWDCNDNGVGDATDISSGTSMDLNMDEIPDECRLDADTDGVVDPLDNCPTLHNPDQRDSDHDGTGDACEGLIFADGFETGDLSNW